VPAALFSLAPIPVRNSGLQICQYYIDIAVYFRFEAESQHRFAGVIRLIYTLGMSDTELSLEDTQALIAYARQKFAEERYPLALPLRPVRDALAKLDPKPTPEPVPERKPHVPNSAMRKKRRH
jgi:hypothetical protein